MAERAPISEEAAIELHARSQQPMSDADKIRFREERAEWAEEGQLPESLDFAEVVESLTQEDVPRIEEAVRGKIAVLMAKVTNGEAAPEEMNTVFSRIYSLHSRKLIGDEVFQTAENFFRLRQKGILREDE